MSDTLPVLDALSALVDSARRLQEYAAQREYARTAARADQLATNLDAIRVRLVRLGAPDLPNAWEGVDSGRRAVVALKRQILARMAHDLGGLSVHGPVTPESRRVAERLHDMAPTPLIQAFTDGAGRPAWRYLGHDRQTGIHAGSEMLRYP